MIRLTIPLLSLGLYLNFAAHNSKYVTIGKIALWSAFALLIGIVVMLSTWKLGKNAITSALCGSLVALSFWSFGYIDELIPAVPLTLLVVYIAFIVLTVLMLRGLRLSKVWKTPLLVFATVSVLTPSMQLSLYTEDSAKVEEYVPSHSLQHSVYIVVLDRYARADVLQEYFEYDNTPFLEELEAKGFQIATKSRANYAITSASLASMLNVQYLDVLLPHVDETEKSHVPLLALIQENAVEQLVGDNWTVVGSWWQPTKGSDSPLSEFSSTLLYSTVLQPLISVWNSWEYNKFLSENRRIVLHDPNYVDQILHQQFDVLHKLVANSYNEVVLAHISSPHPPYTRDANGNEPDSSLPTGVLYVGQLEYTNKLILDWLDNTPPEATIVLMSDEGPKGLEHVWEDAQVVGDFSLAEKIEIHTPILMAVRGFDIYDEVTPVNMIRLLLNTHLGTSLELLEDKAFYILDDTYPYKWLEVP